MDYISSAVVQHYATVLQILSMIVETNKGPSKLGEKLNLTNVSYSGQFIQVLQVGWARQDTTSIERQKNLTKRFKSLHLPVCLINTQPTLSRGHYFLLSSRHLASFPQPPSYSLLNYIMQEHSKKRLIISDSEDKGTLHLTRSHYL